MIVSKQLMKSAILYGSRVKLTGAHKPVFTPRNGKRAEYYVRVKVVDLDINEALLKARPMVGETVLNTVPL